jgi:hypothetical protein
MGAEEPLIAAFAPLVFFAQALIAASQVLTTTQIRIGANLCRFRLAPVTAMTSAIARRRKSASALGTLPWK